MSMIDTTEWKVDTSQPQEGRWKVGQSTALAWAHKLGLTFETSKKSYYVDNHDRPDILRYRAEYLQAELDYELRQYLWAT